MTSATVHRDAAARDQGAIYLAKAQDCLSSSRALFDAGDFNGACDRAFFAVFNGMRAVLTRHTNVSVQHVKTHHGLEYLFQTHVLKWNLVDRRHSKTIAEVSEIRRFADFSGDVVSREHVEKILPQAATFVDECGTLMGEPIRP